MGLTSAVTLHLAMAGTTCSSAWSAFSSWATESSEGVSNLAGCLLDSRQVLRHQGLEPSTTDGAAPLSVADSTALAADVAAAAADVAADDVAREPRAQQRLEAQHGGFEPLIRGDRGD